MKRYFSINGYWKNDGEQFEDYIVSSQSDSGVIDPIDEVIFYYNLSEEEIKKAIINKENTDLDFVITEYKPININ